jgi:hypothetical protein
MCEQRHRCGLVGLTKIQRPKALAVPLRNAPRPSAGRFPLRISARDRGGRQTPTPRSQETPERPNMVRFACPVPHRTHAHWSSVNSCSRCQPLFPQAIGRGAIGGARTIGLSRLRPAGETGTNPVLLGLGRLRTAGFLLLDRRGRARVSRPASYPPGHDNQRNAATTTLAALVVALLGS